jgi:hypothetical protein
MSDNNLYDDFGAYCQGTVNDLHSVVDRLEILMLG